MKAPKDLTDFASKANGRVFRNKVGAAVVAVRRPGAVHPLDSMDHFFPGEERIIVGRAIGFGREKGKVLKDDEGMQLVKSLGQRMAWLLNRLHG